MTAVLAKNRAGASKPLSRIRWKPQLQKYHLQWQAIFKAHGWAGKSDKEKRELRHAVLEDLFGEVINAASASDLQWDCIYFAQELLLSEGIVVWSKEMAKYAKEEGTCKRYIWNIEHAGYDLGIERYGAPEEYIESISEDKFGIKDWRVLNSKQLWQLFITIKNRVKASGGNLHKTKLSESEPF